MSAWEWPDALDALAAAGAHHTRVLEDDAVRILDTRIGPGETTAVHTHRWPSVLCIVATSHHTRRDGAGALLSDTRETGLPPPGTVVELGPLGPHSVENVGDDEIRLLDDRAEGEPGAVTRAPRLRCQITMSADGYVAGPRQSVDDPLGIGGLALHGWAFATRSFRAVHGGEGGATGLDDDRIAAATANLGATIMGRNMFGPIRGPWADEDWRGWWGDDPPYHTPVFVLTHHPRDPLAMEGGTTFNFVTDGIEAALELALEAADGLDVAVGGGAGTVQQYLRARLVDELELHVVPMFLGAGERLFENLDGGPKGYACTGLMSSSAVAHYSYAKLDQA